MNKYLEKIAKRKAKTDTLGVLKGTAAYVVGGTAGSMAGSLISKQMSKPVLSEIDKTVPEIKKEHLRKIIRKHKIPVTFSGKKFVRSQEEGNARRVARQFVGAQSGSPYYFHGPRAGIKGSYIEMAGSKNTGAAAHELGHAMDYMKHGGSSIRNTFLSNKILQHGTALAGGLEALSKNNTIGYGVAPAVAASGALLELHHEYKANKEAYKALKEVGGHTPARAFLKRVASKNMMHYGGKALIPALSVMGIHALANRFRKKNVKKPS